MNPIFAQHSARISTRLGSLGLLAAALALSGCNSSNDSGPAPAAGTASNQLYTQTNEQVNAIVHMSRGSDGSLTIVNRVYTGGSGSDGVKYGDSTNTPVADSLTSNHSVIISPDKTTLFAVNAGDNSVSVFSIDASGNLTLKATSATGGLYPTSLAYHDGTLYVSFQGGLQNLQAYHVGNDGSLRVTGAWELPLNGSNKNLPTELTLSPDNSQLIAITGPGSNQIVSYPVNSDGSLGSPIANTTGVTSPFAGIFTPGGAFLATDITDKALAAFSVSSGSLSAIGSPVVSGITAPCWLAITPSGKYAYVGNGQGPISSYSVASNGALTLLNATATTDATLKVSGDSWVSPDGKYLYTAYFANDEVIAYQIASDGSLSTVGSPAALHTVTGVSTMGLAGL